MGLLRKAILFFSHSLMLHFDSLKNFVKRWDINFFNKRQNPYNELQYNIKDVKCREKDLKKY